MRNLLKLLFLFIIGGLIYYGIELLWRGWSHWSMFILGGLCFVCCGLINEVLSWDTRLQIQALIGGGIITALEFVTGCVVNLWMGWAVWDYSMKPLNLLGQICFFSSFMWCALSVIAIMLDDYIRWIVFKEEKPRYCFRKKKPADLPSKG